MDSRTPRRPGRRTAAERRPRCGRHPPPTAPTRSGPTRSGPRGRPVDPARSRDDAEAQANLDDDRTAAIADRPEQARGPAAQVRSALVAASAGRGRHGEPAATVDTARARTRRPRRPRRPIRRRRQTGRAEPRPAVVAGRLDLGDPGRRGRRALVPGPGRRASSPRRPRIGGETRPRGPSSPGQARRAKDANAAGGRGLEAHAPTARPLGRRRSPPPGDVAPASNPADPPRRPRRTSRPSLKADPRRRLNPTLPPVGGAAALPRREDSSAHGEQPGQPARDARRRADRLPLPATRPGRPPRDRPGRPSRRRGQARRRAQPADAEPKPADAEPGTRAGGRPTAPTPPGHQPRRDRPATRHRHRDPDARSARPKPAGWSTAAPLEPEQPRDAGTGPVRRPDAGSPARGPGWVVIPSGGKRPGGELVARPREPPAMSPRRHEARRTRVADGPPIRDDAAPGAGQVEPHCTRSRPTRTSGRSPSSITTRAATTRPSTRPTPPGPQHHRSSTSAR